MDAPSVNLPGPEPEYTSDSRTNAQAKPGGKAPPRYPSAEECMELLHRLSGMVGLGVFTPAQSNAMRGCLRDIWSYQQRTAGSQSGPAVDARLLDLLPKNPELLDYLAPFLTPEQVAKIAQQIATDHAKT